ncbi:hypothetical protein [Streptosporangium carneum]|uniref:Uncharacterized protein n=1 Tax=Streptosporangium carneum TaxID=47481 RepID=A0A9W6I9D5_9ACTN|nr:hypothetical protein [Streptosporangium carneum]GLK13598.1 hypothetical protein GCM10017600_70090 [Streptosporangium carneum]
MAIELDPDWPGLTVKNDSSGKGGPEVNHTAIREIAQQLEGALRKLTTATKPPPTAMAYAKGTTPPPLPGPPPGAGSLPDLQLQCAIGDAQLGQWTTAQQFAMAIGTAYSVLIGERGHKGSGLYAQTTEQYGAVIQSLHEIVKAYDGADQANQGANPTSNA